MSGQPEPFPTLLDWIDRELAHDYGQLSALVERLEQADETFAGDNLTELGYRLALGEILAYVLTARHALHGAQTGVTRGRAEIHRYRRD